MPSSGLVITYSNIDIVAVALVTPEVPGTELQSASFYGALAPSVVSPVGRSHKLCLVQKASPRALSSRAKRRTRAPHPQQGKSFKSGPLAAKT